MSKFGWDLPAGCTTNDIDRAYGLEEEAKLSNCSYCGAFLSRKAHHTEPTKDKVFPCEVGKSCPDGIRRNYIDLNEKSPCESCQQIEFAMNTFHVFICTKCKKENKRIL